MNENNLPGYDEKKCLFFALGRNAMYAACQAIGLRAEDEILTPAFDCDGALQPFKVMRCRLKFFRSDPCSLNADLDDIKMKITAKTKLIHIINHFGMPQCWDELLSLRREVGIPILEDNAYSLFSKINNIPFGAFGDIAVFSLRKNLPLIEGGMLRINNPAYTYKPLKNRGPFFYPLARYLLDRFNYRIRKPPPPLYSEEEKGRPYWPCRDVIGKEFSRDYLRPMSVWAKNRLYKYSPETYAAIMEKKRYFYLFLSRRIDGLKGIKVLWPDLPEGVAPFCFSFLVESGRDMLLKSLRRKYSVMAWPTLPGAILERLKEFPDVEILGRRLLQINLPADKVMMSDFARDMEGLIRDIAKFQNGL